MDYCEKQQRFHDLGEQGKVSPECETLVSGLLMLMELILTVFMEKTTRKGSRNLGLPSSQTPPDETAMGKTGAKGKGQDPKVHDNACVREVTACSECGRDMAGVDISGDERRTKHVDAEIKTCPDCGAETRGAFPDAMPGPLQYGHGIVAFATHLLAAQMVPLRCVAQTVKALVGTTIAEATLLAWIWCLHEALADWEEQAMARLLASPILHADETSIRINGKNHWLHSCSTDDLTLSFCNPKQSRNAIDDIGIIPATAEP